MKIHISEEELIASIVAYFKAWEYFLIRPHRYYNKALKNQHVEAIRTLNIHVEEIVKIIKSECKDITDKNIFIGFLLREVEAGSMSTEEMYQCVLEMLLAATDTSSVTMYYGLLAFAEDKTKFADDLLLDMLHQQSAAYEDNNSPDSQDEVPVSMMLVEASCRSTNLKYFLDETLRFKPVGPIIIRKANTDDVIPSETGDIKVHAGDGVIVSIDEMNKTETIFSNAHTFDPRRFQDNPEIYDSFFPFG